MMCDKPPDPVYLNVHGFPVLHAYLDQLLQLGYDFFTDKTFIVRSSPSLSIFESNYIHARIESGMVKN